MFGRVKIVITGLVYFLAVNLGGYDNLLSLLVTILILDWITGFTKAVLNKEVSSSELRNGLIRKGFIFLVIHVMYRVDKSILDYAGDPLTLVGLEVSLRSLFIVYALIEESVSLVENLGKIGVPLPRWLSGVLKQLSDYSNKSMPQVILTWLEKWVPLSKTNGSTDTKEDDDTEDTVSKEE